MEPAEAQRKSQEGNPASSKLWVAVKPKALVTVAVMLDVVLARTRGGGRPHDTAGGGAMGWSGQ